jgi:hypothetical protein
MNEGNLMTGSAAVVLDLIASAHRIAACENRGLMLPLLVAPLQAASRQHRN